MWNYHVGWKKDGITINVASGISVLVGKLPPVKILVSYTSDYLYPTLHAKQLDHRWTHIDTNYRLSLLDKMDDHQIKMIARQGSTLKLNEDF